MTRIDDEWRASVNGRPVVVTTVPPREWVEKAKECHSRARYLQGDAMFDERDPLTVWVRSP